jgi:hypothetical protein
LPRSYTIPACVHYAAFILDHSDALTRRTLLDTPAPVIAERCPTLRGVGT